MFCLKNNQVSYLSFGVILVFILSETMDSSVGATTASSSDLSSSQKMGSEIQFVHSQVDGTISYSDVLDDSQRKNPDRTFGLSYLAWEAMTDIGSSLYLQWQLRPDASLYDAAPDDRIGRVSRSRALPKLLNHYGIGFQAPDSFDFSYGVFSLENTRHFTTWNRFSLKPLMPERTLGGQIKLFFPDDSQLNLYVFKPFNESGESQRVEEGTDQTASQSNQPYYGFGLTYSQLLAIGRFEVRTLYWDEDNYSEDERGILQKIKNTHLHLNLGLSGYFYFGEKPAFLESLVDYKVIQRNSDPLSLEDLSEFSILLRGWYQSFKHAGFSVSLGHGQSQMPSTRDWQKKVVYEGQSIELAYFYYFAKNLQFDFYTHQDFRIKNDFNDDTNSGGIEFSDGKKDFMAVRYGLRVTLNTGGVR